MKKNCFKVAFVILLVMHIFGNEAHTQILENSDMQDSDSFKVVQSKDLSELQQFASWFHQDWKLLFPDFYTGTEMYLKGLSSDRQATLKRELHDFLDKNKNASEKVLFKSWLDLGAQGWDSKLEIRAALLEFATSI
jgi:hypothetical protein